MEESGFGGLFGDPDDLQRRLGEFAEQMQGAQRLAWADNAIKLAVDLTVAAMNRVNIQGTTEQQSEQLRTVMAHIVPEAVTPVREPAAVRLATETAGLNADDPSWGDEAHPSHERDMRLGRRRGRRKGRIGPGGGAAGVLGDEPVVVERAGGKPGESRVNGHVVGPGAGAARR